MNWHSWCFISSEEMNLCLNFSKGRLSVVPLIYSASWIFSLWRATARKLNGVGRGFSWQRGELGIFLQSKEKICDIIYAVQKSVLFRFYKWERALQGRVRSRALRVPVTELAQHMLRYTHITHTESGEIKLLEEFSYWYWNNKNLLRVNIQKVNSIFTSFYVSYN